MPTYMDVHRNVKAAPEDIALAHEMDQRIQSQYGVRYTRYWYDEDLGSVYCLVEAPDVHKALRVHKEAHGLMPDQVIEVRPDEVDAFLGAERDTPSGTEPSDGGFRVVMFTDMQDSTRLASELGDSSYLELLGEHDGLVRAELSRHTGQEVKHTGDGFLASFASASRSIECAIAIQRALSARNEAHGRPAIRVRIGMTAGEPVESGGDLFGSTVNLAARICAHAEGDEILTSEVVRELCRGRPFGFTPRPPATLKGFAEEIRLLQVEWRAD